MYLYYSYKLTGLVSGTYLACLPSVECLHKVGISGKVQVQFERELQLNNSQPVIRGTKTWNFMHLKASPNQKWYLANRSYNISSKYSRLSWFHDDFQFQVSTSNTQLGITEIYFQTAAGQITETGNSPSEKNILDQQNLIHVEFMANSWSPFIVLWSAF